MCALMKTMLRLGTVEYSTHVGTSVRDVNELGFVYVLNEDNMHFELVGIVTINFWR